MSLWCCLFLTLMVVLVVTETTATNKKSLPVTKGDNGILNCSTSEMITDITEVSVEWTRDDLNEFVLLFKEGKLDLSAQESLFKDRVKLFDLELKNGNLSMILKNVTLNDTGTYRCHFSGASARKRRAVDTNTPVIRTIELTVKESESNNKEQKKDEESPTRGSPGLVVGLVAVVAVVAVAVFAGLYVYRSRFRKSQHHQQDVTRTGQNGPEQTPLSDPSV